MDDFGVAGTREKAFMSHAHNVLGFDPIRPAGSSSTHRPRGIFKIYRIYAAGGAVPDAVSTEVFVQFTVVEPLFLSPFISGDIDGHKSGIYGINNMNLTINFLSTANRAWRAARFPIDVSTANDPTFFGKTAVIHAIDNAELQCMFYTPKGSQLQNPRCVVNYHEIGIYRTSNYGTIPASAAPNSYGLMTTSGFLPFPSATLQSSNIQLNSIPEKLIIFARRNQSLLTCMDADTYLVINDVRINWNNSSGNLATFTQQQLYDASLASGLKDLSWEQFSGSTIGPASAINASTGGNTRSVLYNGWQRNAYSGTGATATSVGFKQIPTTGSILVLDMGRTIALSQEFESVGSIGQYSLQIQVNVSNQHKYAFNAGEYELVVLVVNPGVLITQQGSSSSYIGLLTKSDVLDTIEQPDFVTVSHARHLTGGNFLNTLKNAVHWVGSKITPIKNFLAQHIDHPIANKAVEVANALGYGYTAAGKHKLHDRLM